MIAISSLAVVCLLTFLHYVGAQMRAPVLPLPWASSSPTTAMFSPSRSVALGA